MTSVADLIVNRLCEAGVVTLFGMPGGGSNLDVIDAAGRAGLPFVLTASETGAAIAALAQAEITGRLGACVTTLGPGVSSVVNGVACAYLDRAPLLVITDRHPAAAGACEHQRLDHRALLAPVTKWSTTVSAKNADEVMREAIDRAMAGPPGPVHVDVPADVVGQPSRRGGPAPVLSELVLRQAQHERVEGCPPQTVERGAGPSTLVLSLTKGELRAGTSLGPYGSVSAKRPLLLVGLGARRAEDAAAIHEFCATHHVPVMVTYKAKGVVADDDPHFAGVFTNGAIEREVLNQADLFIGVGLDPVELLPRPWTHAQPIVSIAPWRVEDRHVPFAAQDVGDIASGLGRIGQQLAASAWNLDDVGALVAAQRRQLLGAGDQLTPDLVVRTVAAVAPDVRVTVDAGAHMFPTSMLWPVAQPNGMLISNGLSTMGFAVPAAIGAALADRSRPVIALTGDGGLLMCAGELLTAAREGLRVAIVVFSDASLSLIAIKQQQRKLATAGVALGDVAWCALAESMGVSAYFAVTEDEVARAVGAALTLDGPSLIEVRVDTSRYSDVLRAIRG
jgi:acetolactate synthase I/II/III large subunit